MPGVTTLGNLDHALLQAIDKSLGEDSEPRVFIDEASVRAVFRVMTDEWMAAGGHSADLRRMLRTYVAMIVPPAFAPGWRPSGCGSATCRLPTLERVPRGRKMTSRSRPTVASPRRYHRAPKAQ